MASGSPWLGLRRMSLSCRNYVSLSTGIIRGCAEPADGSMGGSRVALLVEHGCTHSTSEGLPMRVCLPCRLQGKYTRHAIDSIKNTESAINAGIFGAENAVAPQPVFFVYEPDYIYWYVLAPYRCLMCPVAAPR